MKVRISAFHLLSYWVYFIFWRWSQVSETVVFCRWWPVVTSLTRLSPGYKTASFGQQLAAWLLRLQPLGLLHPRHWRLASCISLSTFNVLLRHIPSFSLFKSRTWCANAMGASQQKHHWWCWCHHHLTLAWGTIYAIKTQLFNGIFFVLEYKVLSSGHHCIISPIQ